MTTPDSIPTALQQFLDATNQGDSDTLVAAFTDDAVLNDWGRVYNGHDGVRRWNASDNIGVQANFDLVSLTQTDSPDTYVAILTVSGNGYNGTGPMTVVIKSDLIAELTISPTH